MAQAWIIVVGIGLPVIGSGMVLGTSTGRPSTFTWSLSTCGWTGFDSVAVAVGIHQSCCFFSMRLMFVEDFRLRYLHQYLPSEFQFPLRSGASCFAVSYWFFEGEE